MLLSRRKTRVRIPPGTPINSTTSTRFRENHLHRTDYRFSLLLPETASHRFPRLPSVTITARGFSNTFAVGRRYRIGITQQFRRSTFDRCPVTALLGIVGTARAQKGRRSNR